MKNGIHYLLILLFLLLISSASAQEINPTAHCGNLCNFSQLTSDIQVNKLEKVGNTMWIATKGGLIKYNLETDTYTKYTTNDGLRHNAVLDLVMDQNNVLWLATGAGLCKMEEDCFYYEEQPDHDSPYRICVEELMVDAANRLWLRCDVWSAYTLMRYEESTGMVHTPLAYSGFDGHVYENPVASTLTADGKGMWLVLRLSEGGTAHNLVYYDLEDNFELIEKQLELETSYIAQTMEVDDNGNVWFAARGKAYKYDITAKKLESFETDSHNEIRRFAFHRSPEGRLDFWFNTNGPIISRNHADFYFNLSTEYMLINRLQNIDGELWICSDEGIFRYESDDVFEQPIQLKQALPSNQVNALAADEKGGMWISFSNAISSLIYYNTTTSAITNYEEAPGASELSLIGDELWLLGHHQLHRKVPNSNIFEEQVKQDNNMYLKNHVMTTHQSEVYIVGIQEDGEEQTASLLRPKNGALEAVAQFDSPINALASDGESTLYVGTSKGLYTYEEGTVAMLHEDIHVNYLIYDELEEKLWLQQQLEWFENKFFYYTIQDGLQASEESISENGIMLIDQNQELWIGGYWLRTISNTAPYTTLDGLPAADVRCLAIDQENNIWAGTGNGLVILEQENQINASQTHICKGETIQFSHQLPEGSDFTWEIGNIYGTVYDRFTNTNDDFEYNFGQNSNYVVKLYYTDAEGCEKQDKQRIYVYQEADEVYLKEVFPLCNLTDMADMRLFNMQTYEWIYEGEVVSTNKNYKTNQPGIYTINVTDYCGGEATLQTEVKAELNIRIDPYRSEGQPTVLRTNISDPTASFIWSTGSTQGAIQVTESGRYSVTVTVNGCEASAELDYDISTAVEELEATMIQLYPNPVIEQLWIEYTRLATHTIDRIDLYDASGRLIPMDVQYGGDKASVEMGGLASGVYFLQLQSSDGLVRMEKVVKW